MFMLCIRLKTAQENTSATIRMQIYLNESFTCPSNYSFILETTRPADLASVRVRQNGRSPRYRAVSEWVAWVFAPTTSSSSHTARWHPGWPSRLLITRSLPQLDQLIPVGITWSTHDQLFDCWLLSSCRGGVTRRICPHPTRQINYRENSELKWYSTL